MTYWTILWVTMISGAFDGDQFFMVYPSLETCRAATHGVGDTLPYDYRLRCAETGVPSSSIRPKARPEGLK